MNVVIIDIKPRFIRMEKSVIYRAFYSKYHPIVVAENGYVHDEMAMSMYIYRRRFVFWTLCFENDNGHSNHAVVAGPATAAGSWLGQDSEPSTQAPSEAPTPRDRFVYYVVKNVGIGTFGKVLKIIKARDDGKALAAKIF